MYMYVVHVHQYCVVCCTMHIHVVLSAFTHACVELCLQEPCPVFSVAYTCSLALSSCLSLTCRPQSEHLWPENTALKFFITMTLTFGVSCY